MLQLLTAVPFSLRADVNLKRQEQMKERHGWIISPLPLWRTVNLTVCWTSVILCLGVFPSKTQSLKPISDLQGEKTQKKSRFFFCSVEWLWYIFFSYEYILLFSCCQVWNGNSIMVRNRITLWYRAEQLQYNYVSPVLCDIWNHWVAPNSWSSLCAVMKLSHGTYPPNTEI